MTRRATYPATGRPAPVQRGLAVLAAVGLLGACTADAEGQPVARDGRSGLQATGTVEARQVAVGRGLPELVVGDCDPIDGPDSDVCIITDTIDGRQLVLAFENPAVLEEGAGLDVGDPACGSPAACDEVTDVAIVTVKFETDDPIRATGGTVRMGQVLPFRNYVGEFSLELPDGRLNGSFDVVPRPED